jgi:glycosyltransferase involved in cell wall biosynthesis
LLNGLKDEGVESVVYCPRSGSSPEALASVNNSFRIKHFNACVPVWGLTPEERRQFIAVGGNLFSFDLLPALWSERDVQLMHSHTLGRLGAIAGTVARRKHMPFVVTIHGGFLDLPKSLKEEFHKPGNRGFDWGRVFGFLFRSRQMLQQADAILTCNPTEAALLRQKFPDKRIEVQPQGVRAATFQVDARDSALEAWPQLRQRRVLLCVGRIDAVKNQRWLVTHASRVFEKFPSVSLVLAGPSTDDAYTDALKKQVEELGWSDRVLFTGGLPPGDRRLTGLFQLADVVVLTSVSETFGLVLLEAWAAGTAVISSRTSGATALIKHGTNGWLFDLESPVTFHDAANVVLENADLRERAAVNGRAMVLAQYDLKAVARRTRQLYYQLIETKSCTT